MICENCPLREVATMGKIDQQMNFKADEAMKTWISRAATDLDCNLSELVRACMLVGVPVILQNPLLLKILTLPSGGGNKTME